MSAPTTIGCEEALRLLAVYLDGELHGGDRDNVERHLSMCRSCYSRSEFERRLKHELAELRHTDVRPELQQHIRQLIAQFASPSERSADERRAEE